MTQTPKDRAIARLAEIQKEAAELDRFIRMYDIFDNKEDVTGSSLPPAPPVQLPVGVPSDDGFATKEEIAEAVRDILRGETVPMHINFLYKLVTERGLRISGQNPKGNLSAKLAPFDDIIYVKEKHQSGWILKQNNPAKRDEAPNSDELNDASNRGNGGDYRSHPLLNPNPRTITNGERR